MPFSYLTNAVPLGISTNSEADRIRTLTWNMTTLLEKTPGDSFPLLYAVSWHVSWIQVCCFSHQCRAGVSPLKCRCPIFSSLANIRLPTYRLYSTTGASHLNLVNSARRNRAEVGNSQSPKRHFSSSRSQQLCTWFGSSIRDGVTVLWAAGLLFTGRLGWSSPFRKGEGGMSITREMSPTGTSLKIQFSSNLSVCDQ